MVADHDQVRTDAVGNAEDGVVGSGRLDVDLDRLRGRRSEALHQTLGGRGAVYRSEASLRDATWTALDELDDAPGLVARGAAMTRSDIVAHATATLEHLDTTMSWQPPSLDLLR